MKKMIIILLALLLLLASCSVTVNRPTTEKDKPYVICTIFPQYDFVKNIVGDTMTVELLMPYGSETHNFGVKDISAAHLEKMQSADLIVAVGGESDEQMLDELKTALGNANTRFVSITEMISDLLNEEETGGMGVDGTHEEHDEDEEEEEFDEHVWTSPKRAIEIVDGLLPELISLKPENKQLYTTNEQNYRAQLAALDQRYTETLKNKTFDTLIFADRFPFRYLCYDYGIKADAAFQGCSSSIEPSIATLDYLYNKAQSLGLPAILYMEGSNPQYAEQLAARIGGQALLLHSCHILKEAEANMGYIGLLTQDLEVLKIALGVKEQA